MTELAKELGKQWGTLDQKTKMEYEDMGRIEKEKYMIALENYKQTLV